MCGIVGTYSFGKYIPSECIKTMADQLQHRGPDDEGFLAVNFDLKKVLPLAGKDNKVPGLRIDEFHEPIHIFLGHRRLSILDLSSAGHQPMSNENGSTWIVYNGEVYNFIELRDTLESRGHRFKSRTDTEVILHAYEEWGLGCLNHFNGMWAFVIFDLNRKRMFCSRDRAGIKPFYYLFDGKRFYFASEIKALLQLNEVHARPNKQIIADYLFYGLIDHTNETFFKDIYQLRPGEYLVIESDKLTINSYWDIEAKPVHYSREEDYAEHFYELLKDSIRLRLRTDVPIGTCLSGGLDSSSITCVANQLMFDGRSIDSELVGQRQKTFSSCFENPIYDERRYVELAIDQTKAEKNYIFTGGEDLLKDLSKLIWHQDEPFNSTSIFAQWKVMECVKERGVKVLLDGQGGDELLAGYPPAFYPFFKQILKQISWLTFLKEAKGFLNNQNGMIKKYIPKVISSMIPSIFKPLFKHPNPECVDWVGEGFKKKYYRNIKKPDRFEDELNNYLYHIFRSSILPGLLHYEDRNSMAYSIETRLPFLDYRLVEFSFSLPMKFKIREGVNKFILREAMKGILPEKIRTRMDKMGFVTPESDWLKTTLRDFIHTIFKSNSFYERGFFDIAKVQQGFQDHCNGKVDHHTMIWRCVSLELWWRMFIDNSMSNQRAVDG